MTDLSKIPTVEHFALITEESRSIHHEGDERSRTNPGHGYPAYTETINSIGYEVFLMGDLEKLKRQVQYLDKRNKSYRVVRVNPLKVTTEVKIDIS